MSNIFFSAWYYFSQGFLCMPFPSRNQSAGYFFPKSSINPQKSNSRPLKSPRHLLSWQIAIIPKTFWNKRRQNSLGEGGGIRFYFPLPGKSVRTDVRWRHNQNFSGGRFTEFSYPWCSAIMSAKWLHSKIVTMYSCLRSSLLINS